MTVLPKYKAVLKFNPVLVLKRLDKSYSSLPIKPLGL